MLPANKSFVAFNAIISEADSFLIMEKELIISDAIFNFLAKEEVIRWVHRHAVRIEMEAISPETFGRIERKVSMSEKIFSGVTMLRCTGNPNATTDRESVPTAGERLAECL